MYIQAGLKLAIQQAIYVRSHYVASRQSSWQSRWQSSRQARWQVSGLGLVGGSACGSRAPDYVRIFH